LPLWYKNTERKKNLLTFKRDFIVFINDLDSPLQKRQGSTWSPEEDHKDDKGPGASTGKAEWPGSVQPGEKKAKGVSDQCLQISDGR